MKSIMLLVLMALIALLGTYLLEQAVPADVKAAFLQKFPKATIQGWEQSSSDTWEADFIWNDRRLSASFREDGTWLQTEDEISASQLPEPVRDLIVKEFQGYALEEVEKIETLSGIAYELELKNGRKELEVLVDFQGLILKIFSGEEGEDND